MSSKIINIIKQNNLNRNQWNDRRTLANTLFRFFIFGILLQILGIDDKGGLFDTAWKSAILLILFLKSLYYGLNNKSGNIQIIILCLLYLISQMITVIINNDILI